MKYILLALALSLSVSAQAVNGPSKVIMLSKADVIDLTTKSGERWHIEDIEDGYVKVPNLKVSKDKLILTTIDGQLPIQEVMMVDRMLELHVPVEEGGGSMGGGGK